MVMCDIACSGEALQKLEASLREEMGLGQEVVAAAADDVSSADGSNSGGTLSSQGVEDPTQGTVTDAERAAIIAEAEAEAEAEGEEGGSVTVDQPTPATTHTMADLIGSDVLVPFGMPGWGGHDASHRVAFPDASGYDAIISRGKGRGARSCGRPTAEMWVKFDDGSKVAFKLPDVLLWLKPMN